MSTQLAPAAPPAVPPARSLAVAQRRAAVNVAAPAALYAVALALCLWAGSQVAFPFNEGSAYYTAVARNLVEGRGLVVDALWSYATPPLILPRPAFELWQPLASFVAVGPMAVLGPSFAAAQVGGALLGATLAPLAWLVTRDAARALELDDRRGAVLAVGSGVLVALLGPLLVASALPDSTIPFAVAAIAGAWLVARLAAAEANRRPVLALGLGMALGVAWLARHEAIWLALAAVLVLAAAGRLSRHLVAAVIAGGAAVATPWLLRNAVEFGRPLPGQALDNALLTGNEQIFAYVGRPTLDAFLGQDIGTLAGNVVAAAKHNLFDALLVPAPATAIGLLAALVLWRRLALRRSTLGVLLLAGALTFVATTLLFPVASLWGTFAHASGPLLVGLAVAAVLGLDRFVAAVGRRRAWQHANAWLAPLALVALAVPIGLLQVNTLSGHAAQQADIYARLGPLVAVQPEVAGQRRPVITDHPLWLNDATGLPTLALPAEPLSAVLSLARDFDARLIVLSDTRGEYPAVFRSSEGRRCFTERPPLPGQPAGSAIFAVSAGCVP